MKRLSAILFLLGVVLLLTTVILSAAPAGLAVPWWTVDGGGGTGTGAGYTLSGTIGQADASGTLSGGPYTLNGGYWEVGSPAGSGSGGNLLYLPTVMSASP